MPLKLVPPQKGRSLFYRVRGSYIGKHVNRSTGTGDKKTAAKIMGKWRDEIERGAYAGTSAVTFAGAAKAYMLAGGDTKRMRPLLLHFRETPIEQITQAALNEAALKLFPTHSPATRNREVYTPVSAVLKHAGIKDAFQRPKGARGKSRLFFLEPDQAGRIFAAAGAIAADWRAFLIFLCYTGCRLSEACGLVTDDVSLAESRAYVRSTKNGEPRMVHLPPVVVAELAGIAKGRKYLFRFRKTGRLYYLFSETMDAANIEIPERVAFHVFRHTYGAWMKRLGVNLVDTGAWKSAQAAKVYEHVDVRIEARKADQMPVFGAKSGRQDDEKKKAS